jgi:hypothetical protein
MTSFFRFFKRQTHADAFIRGIVRFRNISYYRLLEALTGDQATGDLREGLYQRDASFSFNNEPALPEKLAECREFGIDIRGNVFNSKVSITLKSHQIGFALCLSEGDPREILNNFAQHNSLYNAAVQIHDLNQFLKVLSEGIGMLPQQLRDLPASEFLSSIAFNKIEYDDRVSDQPNIWRKRASYSYRNEWRFFASPKPQFQDLDYFDLRCNFPPNSVESLAQSASAEPSELCEKVEDKIRALESIVTEVEAARDSGFGRETSNRLAYLHKRLIKSYLDLRNIGYPCASMDERVSGLYNSVDTFKWLTKFLKKYIEHVRNEKDPSSPISFSMSD